MEALAYRENLEGVLTFTGGTHLLSLDDVRRYTGLADQRTIYRHFPYFFDGFISAETLAKCLSGSPPRNMKKKVTRR